MTTGASHRTFPSRRPPRPRGHRLAPLGVAAWAVLEIWLLARVGEAAGGLAVLALLVGAAVLGAVVVRRAGRRAWRNLVESVQRGRRPGTPPTAGSTKATGGRDSTMPLLGGLLLMVPGLVSDAMGLLCLLPPTGALLRRSLERTLLRRLQAGRPGTFGDAFRRARIHRPDGRVVQGEVVREDRTGGEEPTGDGPDREGPPSPPLPR